MKRNITAMTPVQKQLLQAQHRLEEAQARDRDKECRARTRRLIQTGAILESLFPEFRTMELGDVERELKQRLGTTGVMGDEATGVTQAPGLP